MTNNSPNSENLQVSVVDAQKIFPAEVFATTADFDSGIRQLLPRYDEMLDALAKRLRRRIAFCIPSNAQRWRSCSCRLLHKIG